MAIQGIGVDIVEIDRIEKIIREWPDRFVQRIFTGEEIEICQNRARPAASFAVRFAAKEAFSKALGTGMGATLAWKDFAVVNAPTGQPLPQLSDRMKERFQGKQIHLSLSHSDHFAIATVIIESG